MTHNNGLLQTWAFGFLPAAGWSFENLIWLFKEFTNIFRNAAGLDFSVFTVILFASGCYAILRKKPSFFYLLVLPFVLVLTACVLHKYPLEARLLIFTTPAVFIFIAEGFSFIIEKFKFRPFFFVFGIVSAAPLFLHPVSSSMTHLLRGHCYNDTRCAENREVMQFYKKNYASGDFLFMNLSAQYPFFYYSNQLNLNSVIPKESSFVFNEQPVRVVHVCRLGDFLVKRNGVMYGDFTDDYFVYNAGRQVYILFTPALYRFDLENYLASDGASGKNYWLLLSHLRPQVKKFFVDSFDRHGRRIKQFERAGASIYLYQISGNNH
jgi:hypothetical protein